MKIIFFTILFFIFGCGGEVKELPQRPPTPAEVRTATNIQERVWLKDNTSKGVVCIDGHKFVVVASHNGIGVVQKRDSNGYFQRCW